MQSRIPSLTPAEALPCRSLADRGTIDRDEIDDLLGAVSEYSDYDSVQDRIESARRRGEAQQRHHGSDRPGTSRPSNRTVRPAIVERSGEPVGHADRSAVIARAGLPPLRTAAEMASIVDGELPWVQPRKDDPHAAKRARALALMDQVNAKMRDSK
ncbi:MAG: hypothetical protein ACC645_13355 [Pirellulales bacterium]